jgi:hypothetical protein
MNVKPANSSEEIKSLKLQRFMLDGVLDDIVGYLQDTIDSDPSSHNAERLLIRRIEEARSVK